MREHTPRLWEVLKGRDGWVVRDATGWLVCEVTSEANARFIAAGPDLEEGLDRCLGVFRTLGGNEQAEVYRAGKAALAKARGE